MDDYIKKYKYIITTPMTMTMTIIYKKELLERLILQLDEFNDKIFRKKLIVKIQSVLYILDKIIT